MNNARLAAELLKALSIAESGSMNKAAKTLHISQPSLTRTVLQLEHMLGGPVFERGATGVRLTALGEQMMDHARAIRAHAARLQRSLATRHDDAVHFHFGSAPVVPVSAAALAVLDVLAEMPAVRIHVTVGPPSEILQLLRQGDVEMAMVPLGAGQEQFDCDLLYYDAMAVYGRHGHPLTKVSHAGMTQLGAQQWVLGPAGTLVRTRVEALFASHGAGRPQIALEVDDVSLRRSLVMHSDHLSAFQIHHVYNELRSGLLAKVPCPWSPDAGAVGLLRLLPHTELSLRLHSALLRRFDEAGMQMKTEGSTVVGRRSRKRRPSL